MQDKSLYQRDIIKSALDSDNHKLTEEERRTRVDGLAATWEGKYIVFPNAIYGDWEGALYNYSYPKALDTTWKIRQGQPPRL